MSDVGPILRRARESRGLSQRALARLSGVSNATISLIEKGDTDPSVGLLKKILDGLSISMSEFFASGFDTETRYFFSPAQFIEIGSGPISFRQVAPDLSGRALQIMHERYEPGADTGPSMITHEGEEGGLIIKGHLEVQVADQTRVLGPGDAYQFPSTLPHRFRNVSDEPSELISACTPPTF